MIAAAAAHFAAVAIYALPASSAGVLEGSKSGAGRGQARAPESRD